MYQELNSVTSYIKEQLTVPRDILTILPAFLSSILLHGPLKPPLLQLQLSCLYSKLRKQERGSFLHPSSSSKCFSFIPLARRCHVVTPATKDSGKASGQGKNLGKPSAELRLQTWFPNFKISSVLTTSYLYTQTYAKEMSSVGPPTFLPIKPKSS